ncbi:Kinesin-like protein KIN12B [Platanthera guangdongensis]|uniref:Kinesin-like protein KIN12B n=1 Tax=Platanthera guangdongensis TaxID=2320717 RepID=A0ABR2MJF5_9ASPA
MFDYIACETVNQEMLFRVAGLPMVENCMSGYNSCVFAYGQEEESRRDEKLQYNCRCSFLEIYNEQITDLLNPYSTNLLIREDLRKGVHVENLKEFEVENVNDIVKLLIQGAANRKVAATNMNRESSRSHSVFTCTIESRWEKDSTSTLRFSRLNLVDLAGSERQKASGAEGDRLKEASNINKSLSTLGHVIMVLADLANGRQRHVPYRDSRLTFLLQDSLGGNSKTMIIANVSPSMCSANETLSTLKFAQRAKIIQNNAVVNEDASGNVLALQRQIHLLKEELSMLKSQNVSRSLSIRAATLATAEYDDYSPSQLPGILPNFNQMHANQEFCSVRVSDRKGCSELNLCSYHLREAPKRLDAMVGGAITLTPVMESIQKMMAYQASSGGQQQAASLPPVCIYDMFLSFQSLESFEALLAGTLRREKMADASMRQLEAEIEQLNRLVRQREEDTQCSKMMIKFREDTIYRMEALLNGLIPSESYLVQENNTLSEEIRLLQLKVDRNPEVTRFALENIRLLEQLKKFQGFYEEGERNILLAELSELRNQLIEILDGKSKQEPHGKSEFDVQLKRVSSELDDCRSSLKSCLEINTKLTREVNDLNNVLKNINVSTLKPSSLEPQEMDYCLAFPKHAEEVLNLELELDILKAIIGEEKSSRSDAETSAIHVKTELNIANEKLQQISMRYNGTIEELQDARSVIEALESQQIHSITEVEELREYNCQLEDVLKKQEQEISTMRKQLALYIDGGNTKSIIVHEPLKKVYSENECFPLKEKLIRVQASLEKAWNLNKMYQTDQAHHTSNEKEMDEIRRQVEAETAEVIVCLQEELATLNRLVEENNKNKLLAEQRLSNFEEEWKERDDKLFWLTLENTRLSELVEEKEQSLKLIIEDWEQLAIEITYLLENGSAQLDNASYEIASISDAFSHRNWISKQFGKIIQGISKRDYLIEKLQKNLEDAYNVRHDMQWKLRSLRGATLAITEAQQQESWDKESRILHLTSLLDEKMSIISELENKVVHTEKNVWTLEVCATFFFFAATRLYDINKVHLQSLHNSNLKLCQSEKIIQQKDTTTQELTPLLANEDKGSQVLRENLEENYLKDNSSEHQQALCLDIHCKNEVGNIIQLGTSYDLVEAKMMLREFQMQINKLRSSMLEYAEKRSSSIDSHSGKHTVDNTEFLYEEASIGSSLPEDILEREKTFEILRMEITSALQCLKEVQSQMVEMFDEKEGIKKFILLSQDCIKGLTVEVDRLSSEILNKEKDFDFKLVQLENKLQTFERNAMKCNCVWRKGMEELELEIMEASNVAAKKTIETSNLLNKIQEAQETIKEADVTVIALMEANEIAKLEIDRLKKTEISLHHENHCLISKLQNLQSSLDEKDENVDHLQKNFKIGLNAGEAYVMVNDALMEANEVAEIEIDRLRKTEISLCHENCCLLSRLHDVQAAFDEKNETLRHIQKNFKSNFMETTSLVLAVDEEFKSLKNAFVEVFSLIDHNLDELKSWKLQHLPLPSTWLEEIWLDIIGKDCAVSTLHLCHVRLLLERAVGLNAENCFLHNRLSEANSSVTKLRELNLKAEKELQTCSILKGKLLVDINNSFVRLAKKESEASEFSFKLNSFEEKIVSLQFIEETMLERSNSIGAELELLKDELNKSQEILRATVQEKLIRENEVANKRLEEVSLLLNEARVINKTLNDELEIVSNKEIKVSEMLGMELFNMNILLAQKNQLLEDLQKEMYCIQNEKVNLESHASTLNEKLQITQALAKENDVSTAEQLENLLFENEELKLRLTVLDEVREKNETMGKNLPKESDNKSIIMIERLEKELLDASILLGQRDHLDEVLHMDIFRITHEKDQLESEAYNLKQELKVAKSITEKSEAVSTEDKRKLLIENEQLKLQVKHMSLLLNESQVINSALRDELYSESNEKVKITERLEMELFNMNILLTQKNHLLEVSQKEMDCIKNEKVNLESYVSTLDEKLQMSQALVEENEAFAAEQLDKLSFENAELKLRLVEMSKVLNEVQEEYEAIVKRRKESSNKCTIEIERLVKELLDATILLGQMGHLVEILQKDISRNAHEKDQFAYDAYNLKEDLKVAKFITEKNEAVAIEAQRKLQMTQALAEQNEIIAAKQLENLLIENEELKVRLMELSKILDDARRRYVAHGNTSANKNAIVIERLQKEFLDASIFLWQRDHMVNLLQNDISTIAHEKDQFELEACNLKEKLKVAKANAKKKEAVSAEVQRKLLLENEHIKLQVQQMIRMLHEKKNSSFFQEFRKEMTEITHVKEHLEFQMANMKEQLEMAESLAEENEAIAEERKAYAQVKEEEVILLERSVEELECTVNALQDQVRIVKEEAERQVRSSQDGSDVTESGHVDVFRHLKEKITELEDAQHNIQLLQKEVAEKEVEVRILFGF